MQREELTMASRKSTKKAVPQKAKAKATKATPPAKSASPVRRKPETLRMRSASPSFTVNDLEKSLAWYRDVLGLAAGERWEDKTGKLMGVMLAAGKVEFMLGQDDWKKGKNRKKGEGFRLYCTTAQDVDVLAEGIKARGGTLDQEPKDQPWGTRDFSLTDPDGFKITIASEPKKP